MAEAAWAYHLEIGAGDAKGYVPVEVTLAPPGFRRFNHAGHRQGRSP
jgi:hypothetical protein